MTPEEYERHDATGLARLVADGVVSARELCDVAVAAVERHDPALNAVVETCFERARSSIDKLPDGPLRGVPWLVKDLHTIVGGMGATNGSRAMADVVAPTDGELVRRHRRAGLVLLGKTNTPELGMNVCTAPSLFGPTRHPSDPGRSAGGSSGGSAAAVASAMVPAAHATDSAGSIRIPAANCGLFGLKPSRNRVPLGNDAGEGLGGLSSVHAVTVTVRDSALLLDVTHGPLPADVGGPRPPVGRFVDAVGADPGPLHIGLLTTAPGREPVHPDCVAAAERTADALAAVGHRLEPVDPPVDGAALRGAMDVLFCVHLAHGISTVPDPSVVEALEPSTRAAVARGRTLTGVDYASARATIQQVRSDLGRFFADHDVLLSPTLANPVRPLGHHDAGRSDWSAHFDRLMDDIPFTPLFNVSGGPAASVPAGNCGDGFPIGVQLGTAPGAEQLLLSVSAQLEVTTPWWSLVRPGDGPAN